MAVKRRIIWLDDDAWGELQKQADEVGMNPSRYINLRMLRPGNEKTLGYTEVENTARPHVPGQGIYGGASQAQRDEVLRKLTSKKR